MRRGAHVGIHGPSPNRTEAAAERIKQIAGFGNPRKITPFHGDLSNFDEVRRLARDLVKTFGKVHVLILNAGYMYGVAPIYGPAARANMFKLTPADFVAPGGQDKVMAINHFGHFLLTLELAPHLAPNAKIVVMTGNGAWGGIWRRVVTPKRIQWETVRNDAHLAYSDSKLANVCFGRALRRKLEGRAQVIIHDPGVVMTAMNSNRDSLAFDKHNYRTRGDGRWLWWHAPVEEAGRFLFYATYVSKQPMPDMVYSYWVPEEIMRFFSDQGDGPARKRSYWRARIPSLWLEHQWWTWGLHSGIGPGCDQRVQEYFWTVSINETKYDGPGL